MSRTTNDSGHFCPVLGREISGKHIEGNSAKTCSYCGAAIGLAGPEYWWNSDGKFHPSPEPETHNQIPREGTESQKK